MWSPLGDFLKQAVNRAGAGRTVEAAVIVENSQHIILQILTELRPTDIRVISYRNGTITVGVANPTIGEELRLRKEVIIEALQHAFVGTKIERLSFKPLEEPAYGDI